MAVNNIIKRLQNIMRSDAGINGDAQRIEQMTWLFFLKVYDSQEETWEFKAMSEGKQFESIIPEQLRWRNWARSCLPRRQRPYMSGSILWRPSRRTRPDKLFFRDKLPPDPRKRGSGGMH